MDLLSDPCNDRVVKCVTPPPHKPLSLDKIYLKPDNKPDIEILKNHLC